MRNPPTAWNTALQRRETPFPRLSQAIRDRCMRITGRTPEQLYETVMAAIAVGDIYWINDRGNTEPRQPRPRRPIRWPRYIHGR